MTAERQLMPLKIDIASDVVCPWCIIGYKQLQKALATMPGRFEVNLKWHPFELNPHMPAQGQNLREHLTQKYGITREQSKAARARLTDLGKSLDFTFDYSDEMRTYNTFDAHQLLHWADIEGRQTELKMALFAAFFTHGQNVSDCEVLAGAAQHAGLSAVQARAVLEDQRYADTVREEQQEWLDRGIHAVPTFLFNGKYQVPGAQQPETFVQVLNRVSEKDAA